VSSLERRGLLADRPLDPVDEKTTKLGVLEVVEVMSVGIEHAIPAKPERLMDLEDSLEV